MIDYVLHKEDGEITLSGSAASEDEIIAFAVDSDRQYSLGIGSSETHYVLNGTLIEYSDEEKERIANGRREWHVWSIALKDWVDVRSPELLAQHLSEALASAQEQVDVAAGGARLRYITSVPGQAETYAKKEQQARAWAAESFAGEAPSFIAAEAQALNVSAQSVALEVIGLADYWSNIKGPQIEATRRKWKVAIDSASDPSLIQGLVDAARAELDAL